MSLIVNTKYLYSERIFKVLFPVDNSKVKICQVDFSNKKLIHDFFVNSIDNIHNIINVGDKNTDEKEDECLNKIKTTLDNFNDDNTKIKLSIELFNKVCYLYFKGGIIVNGNIFIKNSESIMMLYETTNLCSIRSCVSGNLFDGIIMAKKGNPLLLNVINTFLNESTTAPMSELLLNALNKNQDNCCKLLNEQIVSDKSDIYGNQNEIIAEHYFKHELLL